MIGDIGIFLCYVEKIAYATASLRLITIKFFKMKHQSRAQKENNPLRAPQANALIEMGHKRHATQPFQKRNENIM